MTYFWNPFKEVYSLQKAINNLFEEVDTNMYRRRRNYPLIDLLDKDDNYIVRALLPGVCKEDTKITIKGEMLTIEGERKCLELPDEAVALRSERGVGSFRRVIELPTIPDAKNIEATFQNGILNINIPKRPEEKPRQIEVKVSD